MRQNTVIPAIAAALLAAAAFPAAAQQAAAAAPVAYKIGYVNTVRVLNESETARKQQETVERDFEKRAKEIEAGPKDLFERRMMALQEEINIEREDKLREFVEKTTRIIKRIGLEERFDAVFLEAAYFNERIDITEKVIKDLDAGR